MSSQTLWEWSAWLHHSLFIKWLNYGSVQACKGSACVFHHLILWRCKTSKAPAYGVFFSTSHKDNISAFPSFLHQSYRSSNGLLWLTCTLMMCPNPWLINTLHHILFIISGAGRAAIIAWSLPLRALIAEPCTSHFMTSTNVGHLLKKNMWEGAMANLTPVNLSLQRAVVLSFLLTLILPSSGRSLSVSSGNLNYCSWSIDIQLRVILNLERAAGQQSHPEHLFWSFQSCHLMLIWWSSPGCHEISTICGNDQLNLELPSALRSF